MVDYDKFVIIWEMHKINSTVERSRENWTQHWIHIKL